METSASAKKMVATEERGRLEESRLKVGADVQQGTKYCGRLSLRGWVVGLVAIANGCFARGFYLM